MSAAALSPVPTESPDSAVQDVLELILTLSRAGVGQVLLCQNDDENINQEVGSDWWVRQQWGPREYPQPEVGVGGFLSLALKPMDSPWLAESLQQRTYDTLEVLPRKFLLKHLEAVGPLPPLFVRWADDMDGTTYGLNMDLAPPYYFKGVARHWRDAEHWVAQNLLHLGAKGLMITRGSQDGGVDLFNKDYVIQVKNTGQRVGPADLRQLFGLATHQKKRPIFFAKSGYTKAALRLAASTSMALFHYPSGAIEPVTQPALDICDRGLDGGEEPTFNPAWWCPLYWELADGPNWHMEPHEEDCFDALETDLLNTVVTHPLTPEDLDPELAAQEREWHERNGTHGIDPNDTSLPPSLRTERRSAPDSNASIVHRGDSKVPPDVRGWRNALIGLVPYAALALSQRQEFYSEATEYLSDQAVDVIEEFAEALYLATLRSPPRA